MHTVYTLRPVGPCRAGDRAPIRLARRWQSSAHTYPTKPQGLMARTGSLPYSPWWAPDGSQEGGSLWLLGEGWPGRSLQHPQGSRFAPHPWLSPFLFPGSLLLCSTSFVALCFFPACPASLPAHPAFLSSSSFLLCFILPLVPQVLSPLDPPPTCLLYLNRYQSQRSRWKNTTLGTAGREALAGGFLLPATVEGEQRSQKHYHGNAGHPRTPGTHSLHPNSAVSLPDGRRQGGREGPHTTVPHCSSL